MSDKLELQGIYKKGYGLISKEVMQSQELSIGSKALYSYLCSYSGAGNTAYPSRKKICYDLGIHQDTLTKYLNELVVEGYIKKEQKNIKGNFQRNIYLILAIREKPVTEKNRNGKFPSREKPDTNNNSINNNNSDNNNNKGIYIVEIEKIVNYLNDKSGKKYKHTTPKTQKCIRARLKEGFDFDDFKTVIDKKCKQWKDDPTMNRYLRPETLFSPKFEGYLNEEDTYETRRYSTYYQEDRRKEKLRKIKDPASL
ncbi:conserved phage C-terminal domain-containing protein [Geotoga petraea]|jgi:uncharacterized phage protein (TIGR02220 family)|uniref:Phage conserved hypothetical protein C-terminal domain-containing protein n=1 Tax=Geotoga petraea TaxID=28234 RepID=A0A1G6LQF2_9BACT|nr:conserved phage C-terminal domain-containing protein [Geotoga petraea]SDC45473.1 phage conserved hypothetical protein, C-terminal domain-containing protein [Geotoga petraea]